MLVLSSSMFCYFVFVLRTIEEMSCKIAAYYPLNITLLFFSNCKAIERYKIQLYYFLNTIHAMFNLKDRRPEIVVWQLS